MNKGLLVTILAVLTVTATAAQAPTKDELIARAKSSSSIRPMFHRQATP